MKSVRPCGRVAPPGDLRGKLSPLTLQLVLEGVSDARGPRGQRTHRPGGRGPRARCCCRCLCPLLGCGVPESASLLPSIRGAPGSQACPPGSQPGTRSAQGTPSVSCPSESLLGQVVGRTPRDCAPSPDGRGAGALGTCWLFWTPLRLQGPTEPRREGPQVGDPEAGPSARPVLPPAGGRGGLAGLGRPSGRPAALTAEAGPGRPLSPEPSLCQDGPPGARSDCPLSRGWGVD